MDATTIVALVVIVLAVIVIAALLATRAGRMRRPTMKPLADESRERYVTQWDRIESKFVDSPEEAVREADALLLALLGEREHPLSGEKLPAEMQRARREAVGRNGKGATEAMRQALLHYRAVIEGYARPEGRKAQGLREVA